MINTIKVKHKVKARKQHFCSFCGKVIVAGEEYESSTCSCDGIVYDWKECERCKPYVEEAFRNKHYDWTDGMSEEDFHSYMWEEHKDIAEQWWCNF